MESTAETNILGLSCPNRQVIELITNKWAILALHQLTAGPQRFVTLQRHLSGISQKVLTQNLRKLERNGLVRRTIFAEVPPRVEYELTPLGQSLHEQVRVVLRWSGEHLPAITAAQAQYDQQNLNP